MPAGLRATAALPPPCPKGRLVGNDLGLTVVPKLVAGGRDFCLLFLRFIGLPGNDDAPDFIEDVTVVTNQVDDGSVEVCSQLRDLESGRLGGREFLFGRI